MGEPTDRELTELIRAAGRAEGPPPAFGVSDVVAASRRASARRRSAFAGAAVAVVLVGGGVVALVTAPGGPGETTSAAAAPVAPAPDRAGDAVGESAPAAGGGCADLQDLRLRALLEDALPQVRGASAAPTTMICTPAGGREVHLQVVDGAARGVLSVVVTPPGQPPEDGPADATWAGAPTASGGYVTVTSSAGGGGAIPFEDDLAGVAGALAGRL